MADELVLALTPEEGRHLLDHLPSPYSDESTPLLARIIARLDDALGRPHV